MTAHRAQQLAGLVGPPGGDRRLQFALGNAVGEGSGLTQRPDDAPDQDQRDQSREQQREDHDADARSPKKPDLRHDFAALDKAVAGGELGQHVEALGDLSGHPVEVFSRRSLGRVTTQLVPPGYQSADLRDDLFLVVIAGARGGDRQVFAEGSGQLLDPGVDGGPLLVGRSSTPD
jgi:hypothetical protein